MQPSYNTESEKTISSILLKDGWAEDIHWDRNDWYIKWSDKAKGLLYRMPAILKYWYDLNSSELKCVDFMTNYFGLKDTKHDALSISMQEAIIGLTQKKLQQELPIDLIENIRNRGWSYMGLEMILDSVKTLEGEDLKEYLQNV